MNLGRLRQQLADKLGAGFLRRSAQVTVIRFTGLLCVFLLQILLARLLGDSGEYGQYAWGQSLLFMGGSLAAMGVPVVTGRFIASLSAQQAEHAIPVVIRRAQQLLSRSALALLLVASAIYAVHWSGVSDSFHAPVAALALLLAPIVAFSMLYQLMCRGRNWMVLGFLPMLVLRPVVTAGLAFSCWYLAGGTLTGLQVLLLVGISLLLVALPQFYIYHRRQQQLLTNADHQQTGDDEFAPQRLFTTARPVFATRIAGIVIEYSNILLVGFLAGPAAAGAYFAAERLAQLAALPWNVISPVSQPEFAAAHANADGRELKRLAKRTAHIIFWPTAVVVMLLVLLSAPLLSLFGEDFVDGRLVLVILAASMLAKTALGPVTDLLLMTGRQQLLPGVMAATAVLHGLALLLLVPSLGAIGAAITSALSAVVSTAWLASLVRRELGINPTILAGAGNGQQS